MDIRRIINLFMLRLGKKSAVEIARDIGVQVGKNCEFLCNPYTAFGSEPYLIKVGDHVRVTSGVRFITHDGGMWILRNDVDFDKMDVFGEIKIGDNVFVGINSIIMPGVQIGDNVCISAGAVVTKNIPSGEVWGGVPARFIKTYDDYKKGALMKCDQTKGLTPKAKRQAIMDAHPEWFV